MVVVRKVLFCFVFIFEELRKTEDSSEMKIGLVTDTKLVVTLYSKVEFSEIYYLLSRKQKDLRERFLW